MMKGVNTNMDKTSNISGLNQDWTMTKLGQSQDYILTKPGLTLKQYWLNTDLHCLYLLQWKPKIQDAYVMLQNTPLAPPLHWASPDK